jgi:hypothetical protein
MRPQVLGALLCVLAALLQQDDGVCIIAWKSAYFMLKGLSMHVAGLNQGA